MSSLDDCEEPEDLADEVIYAQDCDTVCNICNAEFLDPQDLQQHLTQIHSSEVPNLVQCQFCTSSVPDLEKYAHHIRDYHLKSIKICTYCNKIFLDYDQHRKHERRHYCTKKDHSSCSQCPASFSSHTEVERHEYEYHNNDEDGFMLQDFFPILSSVLHMRAIDFIKRMNSCQPCECVSCGHKTVDIQKYIQHLQNGNCKSYSCYNCSNTYKRKKFLLRHLCSHKECFNSVSKETQRKCTECQESILSQFYQSHVKQCKPIKCIPCNIIFYSLDQLSSHQCKNHPLAVEVKLCKFCSRQCVGSYSLRKHMNRAHRDDIRLYKYKCVTCDTPFKHPQKLFAHYFIKHKDLEPYTCKICDKTFRIRKRFTIHIKLDHKSVGFVEFDEKYHVFFTEKKSENPFVPHCVLSEDELRLYTDDSPIKPKKEKSDAKEKLDLDFLNQTETEGNVTEVDVGTKKVLKRKKLTKRSKKTEEEVIPLDSTDEEEVPLVSLKILKPKDKGFEPIWARKKSVKDNRKQLTCNICNKYCYTYQNYQHHMSLHRKNDMKICIKCSQVFKSKEKLNQHIENEHSSSKLTETLKNLLEKRKKSITPSNTLTTTEKFQQTIKKTKVETINTSTATVTPVDHGISVQKFLETFTAEDPSNPSNMYIENSVSIKAINDPFFRKSTIQMSTFEKAEYYDNPKLQLPVRFTQNDAEPVKCSVKIVQHEYTPNNFFTESYDYDDRAESIPEVAQEIMLEVTEEPKQMQVPNKVVLPIPEGCDNISIAHLQPQAPYYKIVKVNEILEPKIEEPKNELIRLPDGTQMITVNPLKHLLGDRNVDEILQPLRNKYYKSKVVKNVENLLTKALEKANTPTNVKKRKSAMKKICDNEITNQNSDA